VSSPARRGRWCCPFRGLSARYGPVAGCSPASTWTCPGRAWRGRSSASPAPARPRLGPLPSWGCTGDWNRPRWTFPGGPAGRRGARPPPGGRLLAQIQYGLPEPVYLPQTRGRTVGQIVAETAAPAPCGCPGVSTPNPGGQRVGGTWPSAAATCPAISRSAVRRGAPAGRDRPRALDRRAGPAGLRRGHVGHSTSSVQGRPSSSCCAPLRARRHLAMLFITAQPSRWCAASPSSPWFLRARGDRRGRPGRGQVLAEARRPLHRAAHGRRAQTEIMRRPGAGAIAFLTRARGWPSPEENPPVGAARSGSSHGPTSRLAAPSATGRPALPHVRVGPRPGAGPR